MKKTYIESLRMIAIILVIYNHTRELGFTLYQYTSDTGAYYLSVLMIPVCKTAVPIFLMISGATLLGKTEDYRHLFSGRIVRYAGIILFWGTLQYLRYVRTGKAELSARGWWNNIYSSPRLETYWYLYLYLGFLLLLPLLRKAVSGMTNKDYGYLFGLSCVSSILTMFGYFSGSFINNSVFLLPSVFFYPLSGYWIDNASDSSYGKDALKYGLTPIISFGIFGFIKSVDKRYLHSAGLKRMILAAGDTVFGIYLTEDMIRNQIVKLIVHIRADDFVIAVLYTLSTFAAGVVFVFIMKKLPVLKRLV
ncbi:MAG: acyltransferase family protein [Lachnospiraceae bacterium]|nr:acyltransferase family protein [Lachnospiraceae bacterium]